MIPNCKPPAIATRTISIANDGPWPSMVTTAPITKSITAAEVVLGLPTLRVATRITLMSAPKPPAEVRNINAAVESLELAASTGSWARYEAPNSELTPTINSASADGGLSLVWRMPSRT